jgi:hypothetical protein
MPTGYTAAVAEGISFEQFVMRCARAMGALIMMRDEPSDAPIPERFEPSTYHAEKLAGARAELDRLDALTPDQVAVEAAAYHAGALQRWTERTAKRHEQRDRYEAMLGNVRTWVPPSTDHIGFKEFMVGQLTQSIDFDCSGNEYDVEPQELSAAAWLGQQVREAQKNVDYHAKANADETERTESRNKWIADLRASLAGAA